MKFYTLHVDLTEHDCMWLHIYVDMAPQEQSHLNINTHTSLEEEIEENI